MHLFYTFTTKKTLMISFLLLAVLFFNNSTASYAASSNCYSYLLMPTQIVKIENTYFIVDCNHNQVLYSNKLDENLLNWKVLTRNLTSPHAIAGDGEVYIITDTDAHRLLTFEKAGGGFQPLQIFEDIGIRPHYVIYNQTDKLFYAWSSLTGEMYLYKRLPDSRNLALQEIKRIPEFDNCYIRSFTVLGDYILFPVVEQSCIAVADINTFEVLAKYPVPESMAGIVQISKIDDYFYLTVSTDRYYNPDYATIVRAPSLEDFGNNAYEDLYSLFGNNGTPYYISAFDGAYYMIHENASPSIYYFQVQDNTIKNIDRLY